MDKGPNEQMCLVSPAAFSISVISMKLYICADGFFCRMQAWSETYKNLKMSSEEDSPARNFSEFPMMQCAKFVLHEGLSKVALQK